MSTAVASAPPSAAAGSTAPLAPPRMRAATVAVLAPAETPRNYCSAAAITSQAARRAPSSTTRVAFRGGGVRRPSKGPEVTIAIPATGETIKAQFEEDGFQMLWLNSGRVQILLSAALQNGWRIMRVSAEEQRVLEAHGFGSGWLQ